MSKKKPSEATTEPPASPALPTISIYQNSEYVAGLLQQLVHQPLVTDETREGSRDQRDGNEKQKSAELTAEGTAKLPGVAGTAVRGNGTYNSSSNETIATGNRMTQNFVYSQAYYLDKVRDMLSAAKSLNKVESKADAKNLSIGDFVEYRATFRPAQIPTILEVLTPELVAEIARYRIRRVASKAFNDYPEFEERQKFLESQKFLADSQADLAHVVAAAVLEDFRSNSTREYYGSIEKNSVTAITICDREHFIVKDQDRILDGSFTVLGKVSSSPRNNVGILERNKLLSRIKPRAFSWITEALEKAGNERIEGQKEPASEMINLSLEPVIKGSSFQVVPIAIYL